MIIRPAADLLRRFGRWLRFITGPGPTCTHPRGTEKRWLDELGTPMRAFHCPDCKAADFGHVYADPATWLRPEDHEEVYDPDLPPRAHDEQ